MGSSYSMPTREAAKLLVLEAETEARQPPEEITSMHQRSQNNTTVVVTGRDRAAQIHTEGYWRSLPLQRIFTDVQFVKDIANTLQEPLPAAERDNKTISPQAFVSEHAVWRPQEALQGLQAVLKASCLGQIPAPFTELLSARQRILARVFQSCAALPKVAPLSAEGKGGECVGAGASVSSDPTASLTLHMLLGLMSTLGEGSHNPSLTLPHGHIILQSLHATLGNTSTTGWLLFAPTALPPPTVELVFSFLAKTLQQPSSSEALQEVICLLLKLCLAQGASLVTALKLISLLQSVDVPLVNSYPPVDSQLRRICAELDFLTSCGRSPIRGAKKRKTADWSVDSLALTQEHTEKLANLKAVCCNVISVAVNGTRRYILTSQLGLLCYESSELAATLDSFTSGSVISAEGSLWHIIHEKTSATESVPESDRISVTEISEKTLTKVGEEKISAPAGITNSMFAVTPEGVCAFVYATSSTSMSSSILSLRNSEMVSTVPLLVNSQQSFPRKRFVKHGLLFSATDTNPSFSSFINTPPNDSLTVETWFTTSSRTSATEASMHLFEIHDTLDVEYLAATYTIRVTVRSQSQRKSVGLLPCIPPLSPLDGAWCHIAVSVLHGNVSIYINGINMGFVMKNVACVFPSSALCSLTVGRGFVGYMTQLRVWATARTSIEVHECMRGFTSKEEFEKGTWPNHALLACYPMDEGAGVILFDYSPFHRHATLYKRSTQRPTWVHTYLPVTSSVAVSVPFSGLPSGGGSLVVHSGHLIILDRAERLAYAFDRMTGMLRDIALLEDTVLCTPALYLTPDGVFHAAVATASVPISVKQRVANVACLSPPTTPLLRTTSDIAVRVLLALETLFGHECFSDVPDIFRYVGSNEVFSEMCVIVFAAMRDLTTCDDGDINFSVVHNYVMGLHLLDSLCTHSLQCGRPFAAATDSTNLLESITQVITRFKGAKCSPELQRVILEETSAFLRGTLDIFFPSLEQKAGLFVRFLAPQTPSSPSRHIDLPAKGTAERSVVFPLLWDYFCDLSHSWYLYHHCVKKQLLSTSNASSRDVLQSLFSLYDTMTDAQMVNLLLPLQVCILSDGDPNVITNYTSPLLQHITSNIFTLQSTHKELPKFAQAFETSCYGTLLMHFATSVPLMGASTVENLLVGIRALITTISNVGISLPLRLPSHNITEKVFVTCSTPRHIIGQSGGGKSYDFEVSIPDAIGPLVVTIDPRSTRSGHTITICEYGQSIDQGKTIKKIDDDPVTFSGRELFIYIRASSEASITTNDADSSEDFGVELTVSTTRQIESLEVDWFSTLHMTLLYAYKECALVLLSEQAKPFELNPQLVGVLAGGLRGPDYGSSPSAHTLATELTEGTAGEGGHLFETFLQFYRSRQHMTAELSPHVRKALRCMCAALVMHDLDTSLESHFDTAIQQWRVLAELNQGGRYEELDAIAARAVFLAFEVQGTPDATLGLVRTFSASAPITPIKGPATKCIAQEAVERLQRGMKRMSMSSQVLGADLNFPQSDASMTSRQVIEFILCRDDPGFSFHRARETMLHRSSMARRRVSGMYALHDIIAVDAAKATISSELAKKLIHVTGEHAARKGSYPLCPDYAIIEVIRSVVCSAVTHRHYHDECGTVGVDLEAALRKQFADMYRSVVSALVSRPSVSPLLTLSALAYVWRNYDVSLLQTLEVSKVLPEIFGPLLAAPDTRASYVNNSLHEPYSKSFSSMRLRKEQHEGAVLIHRDALSATIGDAENSGTLVLADQRVEVGTNGLVQVLYFEVYVVSMSGGDAQKALIGMTHDADLDLDILPESDDTFAYLSHNGNKQMDNPIHGVSYGPTWGTGDVVGCGFYSPGHRIFFTKNGYFLGFAFNCEKSMVCPFIGATNVMSFRVNFGESKFAFDLGAWMSDAPTGIFRSPVRAKAPDFRLMAWHVFQSLLSLGAQMLLEKGHGATPTHALLSSVTVNEAHPKAWETFVDEMLGALVDHIRNVAVLCFLRELLTRHVALGKRFEKCGLASALVNFVETFTGGPGGQQLDYEICVAFHLLGSSVTEGSPEIPAIFHRVLPVVSSRNEYTAVYDSGVRLLRRLLGAAPSLQNILIETVNADPRSRQSRVVYDIMGGSAPCLSEGVRAFYVPHHYTERTYVVVKKYIPPSLQATIAYEDPKLLPITVDVGKLVPADDTAFLDTVVFTPLVEALLKATCTLLTVEAAEFTKWTKMNTEAVSLAQKKDHDSVEESLALRLAQFQIAEQTLPTSCLLLKAVKMMAAWSYYPIWRPIMIYYRIPKKLSEHPPMGNGWIPWYCDSFEEDFIQMSEDKLWALVGLSQKEQQVTERQERPAETDFIPSSGSMNQTTEGLLEILRDNDSVIPRRTTAIVPPSFLQKQYFKPTTMEGVTRRPQRTIWQANWRRPNERSAPGAFSRRRYLRQRGEEDDDYEDIEEGAEDDEGAEEDGSEPHGEHAPPDTDQEEDEEEGFVKQVCKPGPEFTFQHEDHYFTAIDCFSRDIMRPTKRRRDNEDSTDDDRNESSAEENSDNNSSRHPSRQHQSGNGSQDGDESSSDEDFFFDRADYSRNPPPLNSHFRTVCSIFQKLYQVMGYFARICVMNFIEEMVHHDNICDPNIVASCVASIGMTCVEMRDDPGPCFGSYPESALLQKVITTVLLNCDIEGTFMKRVLRGLFFESMLHLQSRGCIVGLHTGGLKDFAVYHEPSLPSSSAPATFRVFSNDLAAFEKAKIFSRRNPKEAQDVWLVAEGVDVLRSRPYELDNIIIYLPEVGRHVDFAVSMRVSDDAMDFDNVSLGSLTLCIEGMQLISEGHYAYPKEVLTHPIVSITFLRAACERRGIERLWCIATLRKILASKGSGALEILPDKGFTNFFFTQLSECMVAQENDIVQSKFVQESLQLAAVMYKLSPPHVVVNDHKTAVVEKGVVYLMSFRHVTECLLESRPLPSYMDGGDKVHHCGRHGPEEVSVTSVWHASVDSFSAENDNSPNDFATVRANVTIDAGVWYYEVVCESVSSIDRIGWASKGFTGESGTAVGDDLFSYGVNLKERTKHHGHETLPYGTDMDRLCEGDVIGCLYDVNRHSLTYYVNGVTRGVAFENIRVDGYALYPCVSFEDAVSFSFGGIAKSVLFLPEGATSVGVRIGLPDEKLLEFYRGGCGEEDKDTAPSLLARPFEYWLQLAGYINSLTTKQDRDADEIEVTWSPEDLSPFPLLSSSDARLLRVLMYFNTLVNHVLPLLDLSTTNPYSSLYARVKGLVVYTSRLRGVVGEFLRSTEQTQRTYAGQVQLNRYKAEKSQGVGTLPKSYKNTLFYQLFRSLVEANHNKPETVFQTHEQWFQVQFVGEGSTDYGGPFRESITEIAKELQNPAVLPLFVKTANHRVNIGLDREMFFPNPCAVDAVSQSMFVFLGMMMGGCMRSDETLAVALPRLFWRQLTGEEVGMDELLQVDSSAVTMLRGFESLHELGVTMEIFNESMSDQTFVITGMDGTEIELCPGGRSRPVTWDSLQEYLRLAKSARLSEASTQINWIRQGLLRIVPLELLRIINARMLEGFVAGRPEISVEALRQCTQYGAGLHENDPTVHQFWQVVKEMTNSDRQALLRFTSGRSRLPATMILGRYNCPEGGPDEHLPVSHTCFFQLDLPQYSSVDVLRMKLLYAIHNCRAIDMDFNPHGFDEREGEL